ncbi:hypothetical protein QFC22_004030 [Naganishia vaughanmartiniae]|uniref:Uncharacterized protein n=1 Tax=Naganishia vaughanmartiniae TaxID=1424756 RepID=A0ACC2X350_9TREE|nr:hypothetical protein QFC22_004030 [Naganishia vaughanmartiniae]
MSEENDKPEVDGQEVAKHTTRETGVWVIIHNKVYDVTEWLDEHPGGAKIILKYAGKDATEEYEPIHPPDAISENLRTSCDWSHPVSFSALKLTESPFIPTAAEKYIGPLAVSSIKTVVKEITQEEQVRQDKLQTLPPLDEILSLHDFEALAKETMSVKAWAYYSSGADDEITMRENYTAFHRILRDVSKVDFSTKILGFKTSMPVYITATALGKLGHKDGEVCLTKAAGKHDVIQMIPTLASCSFDEMIDAAIPDQTQFLQLYVNSDREKTKKIIQHAEKRGVKALFITVDAPQLGRRPKDMRMKFDDPGSKVQETDVVTRNEGAARAISAFIDPSLSWKDLAWFKSVTKLPILLKGVQCWEDAVMAVEAGMQGVVLSGRQLVGVITNDSEFARSGIEVLVEVVDELKKRKMFPNPNFEIFIDGGVRRASDVLKAVALGATAVGIGRPMLYSMSTYGTEGVERALQILKDEFEMNMRLIGAPTLKDIEPAMVDASNISKHSTLPGESIFNANSTLRPKL